MNSPKLACRFDLSNKFSCHKNTSRKELRMLSVAYPMGRKGKTLLSLSLSLSLGVQRFGVLRDVHLGQPEEMTDRNCQFLGYY